MPPAVRHVGLNALFLDPGRSGGPETYLRGLVPALAAEYPGLRLTVATTRRGAAALEADGWTDLCTILALPADEGQRARRLLAEQVRLPGLARRRGWDVVHSLASVAPVFTPGVAAVITLHDVTFLRMATFGRVTTRAMRASVGPPARRADALISGAAVARDEACETLGLDPARFLVVPHGPGRDPGVAPVAEAEVRARQTLDPAARVVLCVAALRPHKNQALLVRAAPHLPEDVVVVLCGHPEPYALELRALIDAQGLGDRVRIAEYVPDAELEGLWALSAAAAFPTRAEGFGLPVLEAMRRGVPVACSDIPVLREVGGNVPHYFPTDDPVAAARAVEAAMGDAGAGARGRERAAGFSWARTARGTFAAYERAVAAAGR